MHSILFSGCFEWHLIGKANTSAVISTPQKGHHSTLIYGASNAHRIIVSSITLLKEPPPILKINNMYTYYWMYLNTNWCFKKCLQYSLTMQMIYPCCHYSNLKSSSFQFKGTIQQICLTCSEFYTFVGIFIYWWGVVRTLRLGTFTPTGCFCE